MSLVAEILDRLTGIAMVREKLSETGRTVDRLAEVVLDHEKRLIRMETTVFPPGGRVAPRSTRALPKE